MNVQKNGCSFCGICSDCMNFVPFSDLEPQFNSLTACTMALRVGSYKDNQSIHVFPYDYVSCPYYESDIILNPLQIAGCSI